MIMARRYEQRLRAEKQEETRRRIIDAAVELHTSIGPAGTTLSAVAERAGVQRNTLYRHFPDERSLVYACSGLVAEEHPIPDPVEWSGLDDPVDHVRAVLGDLYAYFEEHEQLIAHVVRDAEVDPNVREVFEL